MAEAAPAEEAKPAPEAAKPARLAPAELFAKYDADGGGSIDADELYLLLKECDYEPDDNMAMELMAEFGDGMSEELDFEHFAAMLRALDKVSLAAPRPSRARARPRSRPPALRAASSRARAHPSATCSSSSTATAAARSTRTSSRRCSS